MVIGLAVIGGLSSTLGREGSSFGWVPTLTAAAATMGVFVVAARLAGVPADRGSRSRDPRERRGFLAFAGVTTLTAVGIGTLSGQRRERAVREERRSRLDTPVATKPLPTQVADPPEAATALYTPNRDFYRIDTALRVPVVDVDDWELTVEGMVDTPLRLSYAELIDRPLFEADVTIACVSNEVGDDLVGNARWLGCRLDDLLAEAGIDPQADQIVGWSVDGWSGGFPVEVLDGRDAMVAVAMNGEVLPVEHGFPARLIIPGIYGYVSATKWLDRIELTTFADFAGYWIPRGWARRAPIKVQSRIDRPQAGASVPPGRFRLGGVAWAPIDGISKVEVAVDGDWQEATLGPDIGPASWRQWWMEWETTPGSHVIEVRATNGLGETQTAKVSRPDPDGATGYHRIEITVGA
jgi:DMSO/TMAO reductase YedYZ molybdopterin-dependent catalytic subunit